MIVYSIFLGISILSARCSLCYYYSQQYSLIINVGYPVYANGVFFPNRGIIWAAVGKNIKI